MPNKWLTSIWWQYVTIQWQYVTIWWQYAPIRWQYTSIQLQHTPIWVENAICQLPTDMLVFVLILFLKVLYLLRERIQTQEIFKHIDFIAIVFVTV